MNIENNFSKIESKNIEKKKINDEKSKLEPIPSSDFKEELKKNDLNKITKIKEEILKYFNSAKKIAIIAAVSTVGLMPMKSEGQVNPRDSIENNDKLKTEIFNEVKNAYENGIMKELGEGSYLYCIDRENFSIIYNLDTNSDGKYDKNDKDPEFDISYKKGNSNYYLIKRPKLESDLVYNYKDSSLDNATTKTYAEFFAENFHVIPELYGKNDNPVNFREINEEEKKELLGDIKKIVLEEKTSQVEISELSKNLINKIKNAVPKDTFENPEIKNVIKFGPYNFEFNKKIFIISFTDKEGFENRISFELEGDVVNLSSTIKRTQHENMALPGVEVKEILESIISRM